MTEAKKFLEPIVGDHCKADPEEEGEFLHGKITKIDGNLAYAKLDGFKHGCRSYRSEGGNFCGDLPTRKVDGIWVFDGF